MLYNVQRVSDLADSVDAAPSKLLTSSNPKTEKGESFGYLTGILHLAPHKASGFNTCAAATAGCAAACLNTSGHGSFSQTVHVARIRKTKWFRQDKQAFMTQLHKEIKSLIKSAARQGLIPVVRLNGTSDIPWENVKFVNPNGFEGTIFQNFPDVQFYDYTKVALRFKRNLPANYDLTFSAADGNEKAVEFAQSYGARVAVVLRNAVKPLAQARRWNLPDTFNGIPLVDGDKSDLRFLDPPGCIVGLKAKGLARLDTTGFVKDINPA
jgi:hypothetical protein